MTTFIRQRSSLHPEAGVALVEFALVLPVLMVILFGVLDFGRVFNYWNDETHLANEGARFAAVNKDVGMSLQDYIKQQADSKELRDGGTKSVPNPVQVCVSFPDGTSNVGDPVKVTVKTTYDPMGFLYKGVTPLNVQSTSTMRIEATPTNYAANPC